MKKVGIMSMQRIVNYGSFLQAYGLMKIINDLGYDTQFVDYEYEKSLICNKSTLIKGWINKIKKNIYSLTHNKKKKHVLNFKNSYNKYIKDYLRINKEKNIYPNIDSLVIGSDEVFNCLQTYPVGYSRNFFGKGYEKINVISYAASFGYTKYDELVNHHIDNEIKELLLNFKSISVRDQNSYDIVNTLTRIKPNIHLDPVLISNYDDEISNSTINEKNYIIIYAYGGRLTSKEEKYIKKFSKKYNKKIISIGFFQKIADINLVVNPFEVLNYFKNADFVITDTFHGTIFSIKMNTKFCTIVRKSNYNKLYFLLKKMCHLEQMIKNIDDIEKIFKNNICFKKSNKIIMEERKKTLEYLKNNI